MQSELEHIEDLLLWGEPVTVEFEIGQPPRERIAALAALSSEARDVARWVMSEHLGLALERLMPSREDAPRDPHGQSDDWRLRMYWSGRGSVYDVNAWPDDVERGAVVLCPASGAEMRCLMRNEGGRLTALVPDLAHVAAEYTSRRSEPC